MSQSKEMKKALIKYVISKLNEIGFVGEYPHYRKVYEDRIELLVFQTYKWGHSFRVEISTVFLPNSKRKSNFYSESFENIEDATVWDTDVRYTLKGMYAGQFYYTDLYKQKINSMIIYNDVSENKTKDYIPAKNEVLVQKADDNIYFKVCQEVNEQMTTAFKWWDAFNKNNKIKMKLLEIFN